jgi:hypothetical protein
VERNKDGLREMIGRNYKSVYKDIKAMKPGETFEMPDGHVIRCIALARNTCCESAPHAVVMLRHTNFHPHSWM